MGCDSELPPMGLGVWQSGAHSPNGRRFTQSRRRDARFSGDIARQWRDLRRKSDEKIIHLRIKDKGSIFARVTLTHEFRKVKVREEQ